MDLSYAYANARVKAMKSKLFTEGKVRELLEVDSIPELIELLEESEYRESFIAASTRFQGMALIAHALNDHWQKRLGKIARVTPFKGQALLNVLYREYQIRNLAAVFASKETGVPLQDTDLVLFNDEDKRFLEKLLQKPSVGDMVNALQGNDYYAPGPELVIAYDKTRDFRVVVRALYAYHFRRLMELAQKEKTPFVADLVRWRMELLDLMILLRVKRANSSQDASPYLIKKETSFLRELNSLKDFKTILERVASAYPSIVGDVEAAEKTNSLVTLEIALERRFYSRVLRQLRLSVLDFSTILGYLYLKELEIGAIRKIAYAKQYGFTEELKGLLFRFSA